MLRGGAPFPERYMRFDVVIAGGSLAGLSAAIHCTRKGARTLLVDPKPGLEAFKCAEGAMEDSLTRAGFPPSPEWVCLELYRFRMVSPGGTRIDGRNRYKKMCMLDRGKLQGRMLGMALDGGCEVRACLKAGRLDLDAGTLRLGNGEEARSCTFIDATGTAATLGTQCGLPRLSRDGLSLVAQWTMHAEGLEEDRYQLFFGSPHHSPAGYSWIFPKGNGQFNIGAGGLASHLPKGVLPRELVERFIRDRVPRPGKRLRYVASFLPSSLPAERPVMRSADGENALLLVGDAARLCAASVSAGIANALLSGRWAGENWEAPEKFQRILEEGLYKKLAGSYRFKMRNFTDERLEALFRWRIRPMGLLHRLFPATVEEMAVDMLGF
jgi:digeranylgeranylglycerophospholipid reductase